MAAITVRNLPDATHRALKARAASHGRSTEAEVRAILTAAVEQPGRLRLGSHLVDVMSGLGGLTIEVEREVAGEPIDLG